MSAALKKTAQRKNNKEKRIKKQKEQKERVADRKTDRIRVPFDLFYLLTLQQVCVMRQQTGKSIFESFVFA